MPLGPSAPRLTAGLRIACLATLLAAVTTSAFAQGSISGSVTSSTTLLGLPGTEVQFYDLNTNLDGPSAVAIVDGSGNYTANLPASTYGILTNNFAGYINEIYNNVPCSAVCDTDALTFVTVTTGAVTGINFVLDPGSRISGTITDSGTGLGIAGVTVYFIISVGDVFPFTTAVTDINGHYLSNGGSAAGNIFIATQNSLGYQNEVWDNVKCPGCDWSAVGTAVAVTAGVPVTGKDFALDPGASISGSVKDTLLNPLAGIAIRIVDINGNTVDETLTDVTGHYHSGGLVSGTYYLNTDNDAGFVDEVYDDIPCPGSFCDEKIGTGFSLTALQVVNNIDFVLAAGGTFSGTVTNAVGGAPLQDIFINISDPSASFVLGAYTSFSGTYTTHALQPGTYYASIVGQPGFVGQIYNNILCNPFCNQTAGTPIQVAVSANTANVNFALQPTGAVGTITGTVRSGVAPNNPISGVPIQLFSSLGQLITTVGTNASGVYTFSSLPVGSYYLRTNSGGLINQLYNGVLCNGCSVTTSGGTLIPVTNGGTATIDFSMFLGGQISGTVTNSATTLPISGVPVQIFSSTGVAMGSNTTNGSGVYTTAGLPNGTYYLRTGSPAGFINKLYDNAVCPQAGCVPQNGTPIVIAGLGTVGGKNFVLDPGGRISGTVTRTSDGTPITSGGASVQLFSAVGASLGSVTTDGSGNYLTSGLPAGSYFLRTSNTFGLIDEVYDDVPCTPACVVTASTPVAVTAGATTSGRNFALTAGGAVAGRVTDAGTTNPLGTVTVSLYTSGGTLVKVALTNVNGIYAISGVPPGTYYARTSVQGGQNYLDELYQELPCAPACTPASGTPIHVSAAVTANGTNFTLTAGGGAISGVVTDAATGVPLGGVGVQLYLTNGTLAKSANTNSAGVYTLSGVPAGNYYVRTNIQNGLNYLDELYNDEPCFPTCTVTSGDAIAVVDGATTSGIDFALEANLVQNSHFDAGTLLWKTFAAPDNAHMVSSIVNGVFNWHRILQDPGTPVSQATIFYETGLSFNAGEPLLAQFDLANTAATLKVARVLLVADSGFTDFDACTFALPPDGVMRTYVMKGRTTATWTNATIYFYATTPFTVGEAGNFQLDNVSLRRGPNGQSVTKTECIDPLTPGPGVGAPGGNMLTNGDFASGALAPGWGTFGTITVRTPMVGNVAEFIRPANTHPPGVLLQPMTPDIPAQTLMTLTLQLGNSSGVRKRALVLVHDNDFSSFVACAWWMAPGQGLGTYTMIFRNSELWTDPTVAIYPSTIGPDTWFRLDNVSLQLTPAASTAGTECIDPGGSRPADTGVIDVDLAAAGLVAPAAVERVGETADGASQPGGPAAETGAWTETADGWQAVVMTSETSVLGRTEPVDLTGATGAHLTFESWFSSRGSKAEVQVSVDGVNWISVAVVGASDTWQPVDIDLGAFAGETLSVRFVLDGVAPADATMPDVWRIRDLAVAVNGG